MGFLKYYFCLIYQLFLVAMFYLKLTHLFWVPLLVLAMVGTIDYLIPENTASAKNTANKAYRVLPKVYIPLQLLTIYGAVDFFVNVPHSLLESILLIATTGIVVSTFGFTVAHELMHGKKMDRYLALILLFSMNYPHFLYQHLFVHHVWVATKKDCGTSWYGESLYRFIPRAFFTGYVKAYRALERDPRGKR